MEGGSASCSSGEVLVEGFSGIGEVGGEGEDMVRNTRGVDFR